MNFKELRTLYTASHVDAGRIRELSPYYFSSNQGKGKKERSPGEVALWVQRLALDAGFIGFEQGYTTMPKTSWCGNYPRTVASSLLEHAGETLFWEMAEFLEREGILKG